MRRCLAKNPEDRWQSASDQHFELKWVAELVAHGLAAMPGAQTSGKWWRRPVPLIAAGLIAVIAAVAGSVANWMFGPMASQDDSAIARLSVALSEGEQVGSGKSGAGAVPGRRAACVRWIRDCRRMAVKSRLSFREARTRSGSMAFRARRLRGSIPEPAKAVRRPSGRPTERASSISQATGNDIWLLRLDGDRKPQSFLSTPFNEGNPQFSADGRWLAYTSSESGRGEVYLQPFPGPGRRWQISTDPPANQIHVVMNWFEELKRLPAAK